MSADHKFLDQAIDPLRRLTQRTVVTYDKYLREEWNQNRRNERLRSSWDQHYRWMDESLAETIYTLGEERNLKRGEINLALVGPGFSPVCNEISQRTVNLCLSQLRSIVVIDFSQSVVRSAIRNLVEAGVPEERLYGMEYDVTNGISTAYGYYIEQLLREIHTEDQFIEMTKGLAATDMEWLKGQFLATTMRMEEQGLIAPPEQLLGGGDNQSRTLRLTVGGQPLPLHLASYQMVVAGTGAADEAEIWERLREVTSDPSRGARPSGPETDAARWQAYRRIHKFIAMYNTEVAVLTVGAMVNDNPDVTVKLFTDVSTVYRSPAYGEMNRLNLDTFEHRLEEDGIRTAKTPGDKWDDDPNHSHLVYEIECKRFSED
ncbi:MAG: hypothetical protein AAB728_02355 [Patescibacteria group bacterium]